MAIALDTDDMDARYDAATTTWRMESASPVLFTVLLSQMGAYVDAGATLRVMVSFYFSATDTEELAYMEGYFWGLYGTSTLVGDDYTIYRDGGWPTGDITLRVREIIILTQAS